MSVKLWMIAGLQKLSNFLRIHKQVHFIARNLTIEPSDLKVMFFLLYSHALLHDWDMFGEMHQ